MKNKKMKIDLDIYINALFNRIVPYLTVYSVDIINTANNETAFPKLIRVFEECFEMKFQEGFLLEYLNLQIFQFPLGFSVDQNDHIMELVNKWFTSGKIRKIDTSFRTESTP